jgi:hypothetical protein
LLGHQKFNFGQLNNSQNRDTHKLCCLACAKSDADREASLIQKLKMSKRAGCKCKHISGHSVSCPMFPRQWAEKTYPGMDVMSRKDSEWLTSRKQKKR